MKIAVLGAKGQLGRDLCSVLPGEVVPVSRAEADLTHPDALQSLLESLRPDVVINCAAYNFVDKAETEPDAAFAVNAWATRKLALLCRDLNSVLVHFSTDYVFGLDETRKTPYGETEAPGPVSVYGLSKLSGEYVVRSICPRHFVIRTCGLYGRWGSGGKGGNFVETMLRVAGQGKPLKVVHDQRCTPTFTMDLAETTVKLLTTREYGLYHITSSGECSWYELASEIFRLSGLTPDLTPITSAQFAAPAKRPPYSVLAMDKLQRLGIALPRRWQEALQAYLVMKSGT